MHEIAIVGAGKIGSMIAELLVSSRDYAVTVIDRSQAQLDRLETGVAVTKVAADITQGETLPRLLADKYAVLSAAPYHATRLIAEAAKVAGAHYLDLTEDVASTRAVKELARGARTAFIPQCGLAPGFITIVASDLASHFDKLQDVRMRVGALPASSTSTASRAKPSSTASVERPRRSRSSRSSHSTAFSTRPSTPRGASARCARPWRARCAISTTAPSATPDMRPS
jgi:saccharopine dehydrogenase-like NADP-dependent oxidoreductase